MTVVTPSRRVEPARGRWRTNTRMRHASPVRIRRCVTSLTRERFIVRRIDVTITADGPVVRNPEICVIENCTKPCLGHPRRMAGNARRWIIRRHVIGHGGPVGLGVHIVRLVATIAIRRRIAGRVVAAEVTVGTGIDHRPDRAGNRRARRHHVRTLQGKARRAVIKLSIRPEHRVVAGRAE